MQRAAPAQGFEIVEGVFTRTEMSDFIAVLDASPLARSKAGARHLLGIAAVRALASDRRLTEMAETFVGSEAAPFRATLFDKSSESNWLVVWHQDTALPLASRTASVEWGPWSVKAGVLYAHAPAWALERVIALRVCLDDSIATNGPLRVLPGTHARGLLEDNEVQRLASEIIPVDCVADAGAVVAMRPLLIHSSSKSRNDQPRRVLHIEYASSLRLAPDIELAVA